MRLDIYFAIGRYKKIYRICNFGVREFLERLVNQFWNLIKSFYFSFLTLL